MIREEDNSDRQLAKKRRANGAALTNERHVSARGHAVCKGGVQSGGGAHNTQTVRANDSHSRLLRRCKDLCLQASPSFAGFRETRGEAFARETLNAVSEIKIEGRPTARLKCEEFLIAGRIWRESARGSAGRFRLKASGANHADWCA